MSKIRAMSFQVEGIWANGYDKERHSVPALVIAKTIHGLMILLAIPVGIVVAIISPRTARDTIQTWRTSRQASRQVAE